MPRQSYSKNKPYARILVASLLCQAIYDDFPGHPDWYAFTAQDNWIHVQASPAALSALIRHYSQHPDFPSSKTSIQQFSKQSFDQQAANIQDTLTDMGQDRLVFTNEPKRSRSSSKIRNFTLAFPYPCHEISRNMQWLFGRQGEWDRRARDQGSITNSIPANIRKTLSEFDKPLKAAVHHFPDDLSDFTPAQLKHLTPLIPHISPVLSKEYYPLDQNLEEKLVLTLGKLYLVEGQLDLATSLFNRCLKLSDLSEVNGLHYLGVCHSLSEEYRSAENYYLRAIKLRHQRFPYQHLNTAATHHNLSLLYIRQKCYPQASFHLNQALDLRRDEPLLLAHSLQLEGELYLAQDQHSKSEKSYEKALSLVSNFPDQKAVLIAECKRGLARLQIKQEKYLQAQKLWEDALQILDDSDNLEHSFVIIIKADLAAVNAHLREFESAKRLYREALSFAMKMYSENHSIVKGIQRDYEFICSLDP